MSKELKEKVKNVVDSINSGYITTHEITLLFTELLRKIESLETIINKSNESEL